MKEKYLIKNVNTKDDAREYAIFLQYWISKHELSWQEISDLQNDLTILAKKFDLVEEFKENGMI